MTTEPTAPAIQYPKCVEHGVWVPVPAPPPRGPLLLEFPDVDAGESKTVKKSGVMSFHLAGCTGDFAKHVPETAVDQAIAKQVCDPGCYGGQATLSPSFFFHVGDIVYKDEDKTDPERADQQKLAYEKTESRIPPDRESSISAACDTLPSVPL